MGDTTQTDASEHAQAATPAYGAERRARIWDWDGRIARVPLPAAVAITGAVLVLVALAVR